MDEKLIAALIALVGAVLAALLSLYWNFRSAKSTRKLPFLNRQLEYCFEASEIAAQLVVETDTEKFETAERRFMQLFWGPLAIVEDDNVARAMMRFALALDNGSKQSAPRQSLTGPSLDLAAEIRKLLIKSWKVQDLTAVLEERSSP
jgi:hypothetical protein